MTGIMYDKLLGHIREQSEGLPGPKGDQGKDAHNYFKGWFESENSLVNSHADPIIGDYAYVQSEDDEVRNVVRIYDCVVAGTWHDSGRLFHPENNQEFATGEPLNEVGIVTDLTTGSPSGQTNILNAEQGKILGLHAIGGDALNNPVFYDLDSLPVADFRFTTVMATGRSYEVSVTQDVGKYIQLRTNPDSTTERSLYYIGFSVNQLTASSEITDFISTPVRFYDGDIFKIPSTANYMYIVRNRYNNSNATVAAGSISSLVKFDSYTKYSGVNSVNLSKKGEIYTSRADACAFVPTDMRFKGVEIKYLISTGWVNERFIGSTWSTSDTDWEYVNIPANGSVTTSKIADNSITQKKLFYEEEILDSGEVSIAYASSGSTNIIAPTTVDIKAGEQVRFEVSNFKEYVDNMYFYINATSTRHKLKEGVYYYRALVDITSFRVAVANSAVEESGGVSFRMVREGLGKKFEDVALVSEDILAINKDSLITAAGSNYDEDEDAFTGNFSLTVGNQNVNNSNVIVSCASMFESEDTSVPTLRVRCRNITTYISYLDIGKKDEYDIQQWRWPMTISRALILEFVIPNGVKLHIDSFSVVVDNSINRNAFRFFNHGNIYGYDFNTESAWRQAALTGMYGAIVVPKLTSEGLWVCYHDDSKLAVNNNVETIDGTTLPDKTIMQCTTAEIQNLQYINENVFGTHDRIGTMDEFLRICATTGLHPCFSCHPTWTVAEWTTLKNLVQKYNLLDKLTIKHGASASEAAEIHQVFGDSIEMYLWNVTPTASDITAMQSVNWDLSKVKVGFEPTFNDSYDNGGLSDEIIEAIHAAGYVFGFYGRGTSVARIRLAISKGCYEWAINNFYSNGLNW